jgi:hypothetical protein
MEGPEGILTLQRKDGQRESKTRLLLALRDDVAALGRRVESEAEKTERMTSWVASSLKPSLLTLRSEQQSAHAAALEQIRLVNSELAQTAAALRSESEQRAREQDSKSARQAEELARALDETRRAHAAQMDETRKQHAKEMEELRRQQSAQHEEHGTAARELRAELARTAEELRQLAASSAAAQDKKMRELLASALAAQKQWSDEQIRSWTAVHEHKTAGICQSSEERLNAALAAMQTRLKGFFSIFE